MIAGQQEGVRDIYSIASTDHFRSVDLLFPVPGH